MKLAEALIQRSDLQIRMTQIKKRLLRSAKVQEGSNPPENPQSLLKELDMISLQLIELIQKINITNCTSKIGDETISDLLAYRDIMLQKRNILNSLIESAGSTVLRYTRAEIVVKSSVNIENLQKQVDELSKIIRQTDTKIQEFNWTVDLV